MSKAAAPPSSKRLTSGTLRATPTDWTTRAEKVTREDLVMFINACFSCSGQAEFYGPSGEQAVSIDFLHQYILGNYRTLYARTLAAGINHFNCGLILVNLLSEGASTLSVNARAEEGKLIKAALRDLPPQRALKVFRTLSERRVNNRRVRASIRDYLAFRPDRAFDAVKYRALVRRASAHAHLTLPGELGPFLFAPRKVKAFQSPLLESFRAAHYAKGSIFALPVTVAEGLAAKKGVSKEELLLRGQVTMTVAERLRNQTSAQREDVPLAIDLGNAPLTRVALYCLSLSPTERKERQEELHLALEKSARRSLRKAPVTLTKVAAVLDRSYSSSGSTEKRRRPLAVALGASTLLRAAAAQYRAFWTEPVEAEVLVSPYGQTDIASPLLDALEWGADAIVIVSDGFENAPLGATNEIVRCFREKLDPNHHVSIVHLNPVFDSQRYAPRGFGVSIPTVGLRDAEDLPTVLGFARFAEGSAPLRELERYLEVRMNEFFAKRLGLSTPVEAL